jgi:hypothetical protein
VVQNRSLKKVWEQLAAEAGNAKVYVTDEDSAAPVWDNVDRCRIMATHSGIVKFKSHLDRGYQVVHEALVRYIKAALFRPTYKSDRQVDPSIPPLINVMILNVFNYMSISK